MLFMSWKLNPILVGMLIFSACAGQQKLSSSLNEVVTKELGSESYTTVANERDEYLLCYTESKSPLNSYATIKFLILKKEDNKIIHRANIKDGYIKWVSEFELEIFEVPGVIETDQNIEDYKSILNVKNFIKQK